MRASTSWVLFVVVVVTGWSFGQSGGDKPAPEKADAGKRSLDDLLTTALRNSPDLQVAQAKVREAEAELRRTRLTLLQKVIEANVAIDASRATVLRAEAALQRVTALMNAGSVPVEEREQAEARLAAAKSQLAAAEATLNGLTGALPGGVAAFAGPGGDGFEAAAGGPGVVPRPVPMMGGNIGFGGGGPGVGGGPGMAGGGGGMLGMVGGIGVGEAAVRVPRGPMADKLRAALDMPVKVSPAKDAPLADVLAPFRTAAKGVPFLLHLGDKAKEPVSLSLEGEVPLGAAFQALEDVVPGLKCYVREYGILITEEGATAVTDGIALIEFWRLGSTGSKPVGR